MHLQAKRNEPSSIQTFYKKGQSNVEQQIERHTKSRIIKQHLETSRMAINRFLQKHTTMEKIKVSISWSGDNYCASSQDDCLNGIIVATHKTLEGVKQEFQSALQFHIEGCLEDGDELPRWLAENNYELECVIEVSALLHSLDGILTRSAIARVSGINERQIGHYASGHRTPRSQQREKIVNGIHRISRDLAMVM